MAALNLAMSSLACQPTLSASIQPGTKLYYSTEAAAKAKRLLEEFLFGRINRMVLCQGVWWSEEDEEGSCQIVLEKKTDKSLWMRVVRGNVKLCLKKRRIKVCG
jgi:hypothetical protein